MTRHRGTYAFPNAVALQRERLHALEALLDGGTIRHLEDRGIQPGWRCLEVGAGGGSVAAWLHGRVQPGGYVIATDLDLSVLQEQARPGLEVRVHDVLRDELPADTFDIVHMRLLLGWLAAPQEALRRLTAALKPGGWLVAEEMDFVSVVPEPRLPARERTAFANAVAAHNAVIADRYDPFYGRCVAGDLLAAGLQDVGSEGRAAMWRGGGPGGRAYQLTFAQLYEPMTATGLVTPDELDTVMALCDDSRFSLLSQITVAAWGRRPAAGG